MRIAIVEDHAAERQLMAVMCAEYFKRTRDIGVECVTFADAESFIESWKDARYDLLLLDCYLSDDETATHAATGLDIARTLRRQNDDCPIVFITSSTDFAVLGYEVQASSTDAAWQVAFGNPAITMDRRLIAYALSSAHYVEFTFADGTCTKIRTNFSDVEHRLTVFSNFYRTARGVLVNFDYVSGISNNEFVMKGGKHIPITKTAVTTTCRKYAEYTFTRMRTED